MIKNFDEMLDMVKNNPQKKTVVIAAAHTDTLNKIKSIRDRYIAKTGDEPGMDHISEESDISEKLLGNIRLQSLDTLSLDEVSHNSKSDDVNLLDLVEDTTAEDPKNLYFKEKLHDRIQKSIKNLDNRDAHIIKSYFGLDGFSEKNFAEIADEMGISRERVRQIQKMALKKILDNSYDEQEADIDYIIRYAN